MEQEAVKKTYDKAEAQCITLQQRIQIICSETLQAESNKAAALTFSIWSKQTPLQLKLRLAQAC